MRDERNRLLVGMASGCCMMILPLLGIAIGLWTLWQDRCHGVAGPGVCGPDPGGHPEPHQRSPHPGIRKGRICLTTDTARGALRLITKEIVPYGR